jgi:hypothetical protein
LLKLILKSLPIIAVSLVCFIGLSCAAAQPGNFGIYLSDSGELVLSGDHIKTYHSDLQEFELNQQGIDKWNSYLDYESTPKLKDSLFGRDFIIKIGGEEICSGTFWSGICSSLPDGIIISESMLRMDAGHTTIRITAGVLASDNIKSEMKSINEQLADYFGR